MQDKHRYPTRYDWIKLSCKESHPNLNMSEFSLAYEKQFIDIEQPLLDFREHNQLKSRKRISGNDYYFIMKLSYFLIQLYLVLSAYTTYTSFPYTMGPSLGVAKASAALIKFNMSIILLPICRRLLSKTRSNYTKSVYNNSTLTHEHIGNSIMLCSIIHVVAHTIKYTQFYILNLPGWTGLLLSLIIFVLCTGAMPAIRKSNFEIFYYSHYLIWVLFPVLVLHGSSCFVSSNLGQPCETSNFYGWGILCYGIELIVNLVTRRSVNIHIQDIGMAVEVRMHLPFKHRPGQYILMKIKGLDSVPHPFTILSDPREVTSVLTIFKKGDWTNRLATRYRDAEISGPFDTAAVDILRETSVTVVASGMGITPFLGIISHLQHENPNSVQVHLIWIFTNEKLPWMFKINTHPWLTINFYYIGNNYSEFDNGRPDFSNLDHSPIYVCASNKIVEKLKRLNQKVIVIK